MAWSLAGAALLLALGQGVATATTITVTTNDPRIVADGQCSLVEAIVNANNDAATHADCPAGSGADTIVLPPNETLILSAVYCNMYGQFCSPVGLPPITSRITIEGNGATIIRQVNAPAFGLIAVRGNFSFQGVPPKPGDLTLQSVTLSGGTSFGGLSNNGTASIKDSIISGNGANFGGSGVSNGGTLTIENSIISGNVGGGVSNFSTLTIKNSTISGNTGSGVSNSGTLSIAHSTISGNTASSGAGLHNYYGTVTIENSTVSDNTATNDGGGISNQGGANQGRGLTITNSTIAGNRANRGGGISNNSQCYYYSLPFTCPGALTLNNSLIFGNQAAIAPEIENDASSIVTANNFNLFGALNRAGDSGFIPGPTDIVLESNVPVAQILGPLKNNGGPTQTHALVAGSPAIDAGDPGGCRDSQGALLLKDQRGFARNVDGNSDGAARCDIGAVEFGAGSATLIDFDGDGLSDIGVYRDGVWFIRRSLDGGITSVGWGGLPQDRPVPADYDGDGKVDIAVYRDGTWFILRSSDGGQTTVGGVECRWMYRCQQTMMETAKQI